MNVLANLQANPARPSPNGATTGKAGGAGDEAAFSRLLERQRTQAREPHKDEAARPTEEAGHEDKGEDKTVVEPQATDAQATPAAPWLNPVAQTRPLPLEDAAAGSVASDVADGAVALPDLAAAGDGEAAMIGRDTAARTGRGPLALGNDLQAGREPRADLLPQADTPVADASAALAAGMLAPARARDAQGSRTEPGAIGAFAPGAAAPRADDAAAVASVTLPAPVDAPEFPHLLGVQVSLLARHGVQRAELHLNPADMGPVSVQIAIDGTHARVQFGADAAATRQAIEGGLPELAAALRDAGLTLTGGGVSEHAQGQAGDQADAGHARSQASGAPAADVGAAEAATARHVVVRVPQGAVDVYA